ncbi:unnamed protein product [Camellia sinensis]
MCGTSKPASRTIVVPLKRRLCSPFADLSSAVPLLRRPASSPSSTVRRLPSPLANDTSLLLPLRLASLALRHLQFSPRRPSPPPSGVFSLLRQSASLLLPLRLPSLALRHLFPSEIPLLRPCGEDSLHSSTALPLPPTSLLPRGCLSSHPLKAAESFNHHGMQYSTTMLNDLDMHEDFRPTKKLNSSGLSLKDIVELLDSSHLYLDVKDNPVMLYINGVLDLPRCGFSSLAVRVLKEYNVPLSARNILEDPELKNAVKAYSSTGPHFHRYFIKGEFIGGSDIILIMHQRLGLLKFTTDRGRIYPSTSRRNFRGTDMLNNDHMMIMFLAVTSTFAMAMVPFARTATTVTMMYPTMTVMSSTVTTTMATMSVITITMLMNMMSPAMIVVLVNKMSPAVTVIPSVVTSCTSGAVVL